MEMNNIYYKWNLYKDMEGMTSCRESSLKNLNNLSYVLLSHKNDISIITSLITNLILLRKRRESLLFTNNFSYYMRNLFWNQSKKSIANWSKSTNIYDNLSLSFFFDTVSCVSIILTQFLFKSSCVFFNMLTPRLDFVYMSSVSGSK